MRIVGKRKPPPISFHGSAALLIESGRFNDELHRLPTGGQTFIRKGLYRYRSHEERNLHDLEAIATMMAEIALQRRRR